MRRLLGLLAPALLLVSLLAAPTVAFAAASPPSWPPRRARPTGPDTGRRLDEDNPARTLGGYEDLEVQFTWGAAWILLVAGAFGVTMLAGLYYLLVHRPAREAAGR